MAMRLAAVVAVVYVMLIEYSATAMYSSRLVHRFSDEVRKHKESRNGAWPERRSLGYYRSLISSDARRQKMKLGPKFQLVFPSQGSKTLPLGNEFGWLHYTWIDIGTPHVSFLVAVDAGSDLLWLPCDCIQCAPLSASYYSSLDKDLNEYDPSGSNSSKYLSCSHQLCEKSSTCKSSKQPCPYTVNYYSDATSTSGLLVEDIIHLTSNKNNVSNNSLRAAIILGCGSKQSGSYLNGVAPDGLMGLGPGEISVPSRLAKAGLTRNSFSLCFKEDDSGRIFFGDQGISNQQTTPFLLSDGKYVTYVVGVEMCCVDSTCLQQTSFKALVDSGTSFTFLPNEIYDKVVQEFNRQVNAAKTRFDGYPWEYCYKSSSKGLPKVPLLALNFGLNNSFVVQDPIVAIYGTQGLAGFCLAVQPIRGDIGIIGQNFMTGYRMVFDRENQKMGWSRSDCHDFADDTESASSGRLPNPLPAIEQANASGNHGVAPAAVGGSTPSKANAMIKYQLFLANFFLFSVLSSHNPFRTLLLMF
ncbi:aspartic proteinase-like protein 1 isoform X1 [Ipomoea triloba]|uniref:aspartic proteinase-like protein 1 isoform X1 n=1 Tax=Ipomoea triloba TaxID=35885 RepID=UPI00125D8AAA|nr:aspartic proteinase-like protein 1 isoform X1 [Ipomoea triloba]